MVWRIVHKQFLLSGAWGPLFCYSRFACWKHEQLGKDVCWFIIPTWSAILSLLVLLIIKIIRYFLLPFSEQGVSGFKQFVSSLCHVGSAKQGALCSISGFKAEFANIGGFVNFFQNYLDAISKTSCRLRMLIVVWAFFFLSVSPPQLSVEIALDFQGCRSSNQPIWPVIGPHDTPHDTLRGRTTMLKRLPQWMQEFRQLSLTATRIGEADHPGPSHGRPSPMQVHLAIVNPTTVHSKTPAFCELFEKVGVHIVSLSETAATSHVQNQVSKKLAKRKILSFWSPPTLPQRDTISDRFCERGKPTGTALLSNIPSRPARIGVMTPWNVCTRFVHNIVQIGQTHIQLIVVYGYAHSKFNPRATEQTDEMLQFIRTQIEKIPLPFVICGDFNIDPLKLPNWHSFRQMGAVDLDSIHQRIYGYPMPPTCNNVTKPDTAIISKELTPFVSCIRVLDQSWFATHCPVVCTFTLPQPHLYVSRFRLPRSWCEFGPTTEQLEHVFQQRDVTYEPSTFAEWGKLVDDIVDDWLRSQNSEALPSRLPRKFRGRCQPPKIVKSPVFSPLRKGEHGDFEPSDEILTISTKRHVTQVRRIVSLKQRLKFEGELEINSHRWKGLVQEWSCILKAPVMSNHFAYWVSAQPELGLIPWPLPSVDWLDDLLALTKHHLSIAIVHDRRVFDSKNKYARQLDARHLGSKKAFSSIRGSPKAPVTQLVEKFEGEVAVNWEHGTQQIHIHDEFVDKLQVATPIQLLDTKGVIVARSQGCVTLRIESWPTVFPDTLKLTQICHVQAPDLIADKLAEFWVPLWTLPDNAPLHEPEIDNLIPHLPPQEPIQVDFDLPNLKLAISRLRSSSALGTDGISAGELKILPDSILLLLLSVFRQFSSGFPKDFMIARTFALNKVETVPLNSQTRPITVLAQLYRVWGSMICHQILRQWASRFPKQITGFLPKRGALMAAYGAHAELEIDRHKGQASSGLTLDLKKCFNMIRQQSAFKVLVALQIPIGFLSQWIESIARLSRYWIIESTTHGPYECNNGLPEGDVFSVVAMLGIGLCWTSVVMAETQSLTVTWAYADNWAWKVYNVELHKLVIQATTMVVQAFGLVIDFAKTWFWASDNHTATLVQRALEPCLFHEAVPRRNHAKDLGVEMRYSGQNRLGHTSERYQEGQTRLARLAKLGESLSVKEHLLESSIWPAIYYGSECYPVPVQVLNTHRTVAADALFGASHAMNPSIALLLCAKRILDPAFVCIANALRTARSWLMQQRQAMQDSFFECASKASGKPQEVRGPASALKVYLGRINWNIDKEGYLQVNAFQRCHLLQNSFQRVFRLLTVSWQEDLLVTHTHRKALHTLRNPSRCDTVAVLRKLSDNQRKAMSREISGAFQLASQKAKWIPDVKSTCPFCKLEDSRFHRLVECPAFHSIRAPFLPLLRRLQEVDHHFLWFPMILQHPDDEAHRLIHDREPHASLCGSAIERARQMELQGIKPRFFTDGSYAHSAFPSTRFSGYAVVMDLAFSDNQRALLADRYLVDEKFPSSLVQVAAGKTPNEQNIGRAELTALVTIVESLENCEIFSDSAYALSVLRAIQQGCPIDALCHKDNFDIICKAASKKLDNLILHKVAAHVNPKEVKCPLERYNIIANAYADKCAVHACMQLNVPWVSSLQNKHNEQHQDRLDLGQLCQLHLELHRARQEAEQLASPLECENVTGNVGKTPQQRQTELATWSPATAVAYDSTFVPEDLKQYFLFGVTWLERYEEWLQTLRWDSQGPPSFGNVGVTWLELGLSLSHMFGLMLPIIRTDPDGVSWLVQPTVDNFKTYDVQASDLANAAMQFWNAYHSLMLGGTPLLLTRGLQTSLYLLGYRHQASGFKPRPWFNHASVLIPFAAKLLEGRVSYQCSLEMPWVSQEGGFVATKWEVAKCQLKVGQSMARRLKRAAGNE